MIDERTKKLQNLISWEELYLKNNNWTSLAIVRKQIEEFRKQTR